MGLLDPKLDKPRTFELLRKKGAVKAVLMFSGGHDEGNVDSITLTLADGKEIALDTWYCGGYLIEPRVGGGYEHIPMSTPANEDEELADLLEGPINQTFGSWGSVPSTEGSLTWDVETGEVTLDYDQESWEEHHEEVAF